MLYRIDGYDYFPDYSSNPFGGQGIVGVNAVADGWFGNTAALTTGTGRFGKGLALGVPGGSFGTGTTEAIGKRYTTETVVVGQAVYVASTSGLITPFQFGMYDGQGGNGSQCWWSCEQDGLLRMYRGGTNSGNSSGQTLVATTPAKTIHANEWNFIETRIKVDPTAGLFEVRVNTVVVISYYGNTMNLMSPLLGAAPGFDSLTYNWTGAFVATYWDDRYILDDTGSNNTSYLGNVRVNTQLTTAAGDLTQMSVFGASANWDAVNDPLLTDVEYVYSPTMGNADLYTMNPNVSAQNIFGVQVTGAHRQDDSTQLKSHLMLKTGGTTYEGADHELAQSYHYYRDLWELNPNTGVGWTTSDLNAIQAGQKVLAG